MDWSITDARTIVYQKAPFRSTPPLSTAMPLRAAAATTALMALGLAVPSTDAHPSNYFSMHGCAAPSATTTLMGTVPQKDGDLATLECGEYKCILRMKAEGKVMVFLQEDTNATATATTLEADHLKCHSGDDHGRDDHEGDCGVTRCNGKAFFSTKSAKEFTNLEVKTKAKSVKLVVYSANTYGQVKYAELEDKDIVTKIKHNSSGAGPSGNPSFAPSPGVRDGHSSRHPSEYCGPGTLFDPELHLCVASYAGCMAACREKRGDWAFTCSPLTVDCSENNHHAT